MRLIPSDPDVATIVGRIKSGDIDLQPDFQRGEVWSKAKKQRLIDSILRDWHVPPIHVIENPRTKKQEVLDGQQRLVAIRDFVAGRFPVDGTIEPDDIEITALHGKYYDQIGEDWRRRFNQFPIRLFRLVEYKPSEPSELFFRLNQPTNLTGAEQRNAFFGPVRQQIKLVVSDLEKSGFDTKFLSFSNSRMSYDDVLSRTALAVQRNSLAEKITAASLADLYRGETPLAEDTVSLIRRSAVTLVSTREFLDSVPKFNKATLFSWLIFLVRLKSESAVELSDRSFAAFLEQFEIARESVGGIQDRSPAPIDKRDAWLFQVYNDRASARVADVSSVILRDAVIWLSFERFSNVSLSVELPPSLIRPLRESLATVATEQDDDAFAKELVANHWGRLREA